MLCRFSAFLFAAVAATFFIHSALAVEAKVTHQVYLEITTNNTIIGRIEIGLFGEVVPGTVANFRALVIRKGPNGNELDFGYKGSKFHRVIKNFMIQGGDLTRFFFQRQKSLYGGIFADENFELNHDQPGLLSMANSGKDTNGSQFFVTTAPASWLNRKHVVFGKVLNGMSVVHAIEGIPTGMMNKPLFDVIISDCGDLQESKEAPLQAAVTAT
ncbi:hypothetical protein AMATHDRAFT_186965 [Amanita thiersii Skay4041]|uniref:Peptidyl-prolyl cis-trans isomerase n=1 Tax=Amanita thiersii Skay4041 TaxID=703135 RepID=A0A2A9NRP4_9AGAR|nr:hypothetical protein AMATHDRAFT_186965 [Amanita thiersii Skay4041]